MKIKRRIKFNPHPEPDPPLLTKSAKTAARYSVLLMLASLCLPAVAGMEGYKVLYFILVLWAIPIFGWAVYANLFYWAAWWALLCGRNTSVKVLLGLTWLLAMPGTMYFVFFMKDVQFVGWGVVLWLMSFAALTLAVRYHALDVKQMRQRLAVMTAVVVLPILSVFAWQWQHANAVERQAYLPFGAAFALQKLSHLPYQPPPELPPHSRVALYNDWDGLDNKWGVLLPQQFEYRGWQVQRFTKQEVAVLRRLPENTAPPDYQYGVRDKQWFVADKQGKTVWQVPLYELNLPMEKEYNKQWQQLFDRQALPPEPSALPVGEETALADCPPAPSAAPFAHAVDWLGQTVLPLKDWERRPAADYRGYCSPNYAVLVARDSEGDYPGHAIVFSREPFRPLNRHSSWAGDTKTWPDSIILTTPPPGDTGWVRMPEIRSHFQSSGQ